MSSVVSTLIVIALAATFLVLAVGVIAMLRGGAFNAKYGNKLMRLRLLAQFGAIALLGLLFLLSRH